MKNPVGTGEQPSPLRFSELDRIRLFGESEGHGATWHLPSFTDFDVELLSLAGVKHALLDLDGCLAPAYCHDELTQEVITALRVLKASMETVSLATNNEVDLAFLGERFELDHIFQPYQEGTMLPYKPGEEYYRHVLATLAVPPETIVMIGDNPHDDIWGAAQHGINTMLVDRIDPYGFFG
jgi:FMN phosphatase YigB (HAD superfamily)